MNEDILDSYSVINANGEEARNIEIFYKGRKVTNAVSLTLHGVGFKFKESWKEKIEKEIR